MGGVQLQKRKTVTGEEVKSCSFQRRLRHHLERLEKSGAKNRRDLAAEWDLDELGSRIASHLRQQQASERVKVPLHPVTKHIQTLTGYVFSSL